MEDVSAKIKGRALCGGPDAPVAQCLNGESVGVMRMRAAEKPEGALEIYAQRTDLRALINLIPWVGSSVDALLATKGQAMALKRVDELFEALKSEMSKVTEEMIDREFLESEEFFDLLVRATEAAARTRDRAKTGLYARLLRGAVAVQDRQASSPEEYLAILAELTPREIEVARAVYEQQSATAPQEGENELQWAWRLGWQSLHDQCSSVPKEDLPFILLRLQRTGLIHELTGSYTGYEGGVYVITEAFRKLMRYLSPAVDAGG